MMTEPIGVQIKKLREVRGMSLVDLWRNCDISLNTLRKFESGEQQPSFYAAKEIAYALNARLEIRLVPEEEE